MHRRVVLSPPLLAVALFVASLQMGLSCNLPSGDPTLVSLELEADGLNRVVGFDPAVGDYDVWFDVPSTVILRAQATERGAKIRVTTTESLGQIGIGSGEVVFDVSPGLSEVTVLVFAVGGRSRSYRLHINPTCSAGDCDDATVCTTDVCNTSTSSCEFTPLANGSSCDGGNGSCQTGVCVNLDPPATTRRIPLACRNSLHQLLQPLSVDLTVDPTPMVAGDPFGADIQATFRLEQEFLQEMANVLGGVGTHLNQVEINTVQVSVGVTGETGADTFTVYPFMTPDTLDLPIVPGTEGSIPAQIAGDLLVPLTTEVGSYLARAAGSTVEFAPTGVVPTTVSFPDPPVETYVEVSFGGGGLPIDLACGPGTVNDNGTPADRSDDFVGPVSITDVLAFTVTGSGMCGNGAIEAGEDCDDSGESALCDDNCTFAACGDGTVNMTFGEQCDDGNTVGGDPCDENCQFDYCFDDPGTPGVDPADCSDGNDCTADDCTTLNDAALCTNPALAAGTACTTNPTSGIGGLCDGAGLCEDPPSTCGNGVIEVGEDCDDTGESVQCNADCTTALCGDGTLNNTSGEVCDDGNTVPGDGCDGLCQDELPPGGQTVSIVCRDSALGGLFTFPVHLAITPTPNPVQAGQPFTVEIQTIFGFGQSYLQLIADTLGGVGSTSEQAVLETAQVRIGVTGATGVEVLSVYPFATPDTVSVPIVPGTAGSFPTQVAADLFVPLTTHMESYVAGPAGSTVDFAPTGFVPSMVNLSDPPIDTYAEATFGGAISEDFACESGRANDNGTPFDFTDDFIEPPTAADIVSITIAGSGVCGNGTIEAGEDCDDSGESALCDDNCTFAACGDGTVNMTFGEQCDDGNTVGGDPCDENCQFDYCFDDPGTPGVDPADCSDGNDCTADDCTTLNDAALCTNPALAAGTACTTNPTSGIGGLCDGAGLCEDPPSTCGNGVIEVGEDCDDTGESVQCNADCTTALCGDGTLNNTSGEVCDDGNTVPGDGCDGLCQDELPPGGQTVSIVCRNGIVQGLFTFPVHLLITPTPNPIQAGQPFTAEIQTIFGFGQDYLQWIADVLGGVGSTVEQAVLETVQVRIGVTGATGVEVLSVYPFATPDTVSVPIVPGTAGSFPTQVAADLFVPLTTHMESYVAGPAGSTVDFAPTGFVPSMVNLSDPPIDTYAEADFGIPEDFACESGRANDNGTPFDFTDDFIEPPTAADIVSFTVE